LISPNVFADVYPSEHGVGSVCYTCHVSNYPSASNEEDLHNATEPIAWQNCGNSVCHSAYDSSVQSSIHSAVGCKGCHSPLHVSYFVSGVGSWLYVNSLDNSEAIAYNPSLPLSFSLREYYYDNNNDTTYLGSSISSWGGEVRWAWTNISGVASGISSSTRYLICLNCHVLTVDPAEAGLSKMIQGRNMILIPEFTLDHSPHTLEDETENLDAVKDDLGENNPGIPIIIFLGLPLSILIIVVVAWSNFIHHTSKQDDEFPKQKK
jgi:hypothetical protein